MHKHCTVSATINAPVSPIAPRRHAVPCDSDALLCSPPPFIAFYLDALDSVIVTVGRCADAVRCCWGRELKAGGEVSDDGRFVTPQD